MWDRFRQLGFAALSLLTLPFHSVRVGFRGAGFKSFLPPLDTPESPVDILNGITANSLPTQNIWLRVLAPDYARSRPVIV